MILGGNAKNQLDMSSSPATNWAGTISTEGNFLTIIIKTAKVIGIVKAAKVSR